MDIPEENMDIPEFRKHDIEKNFPVLAFPDRTSILIAGQVRFE